MIVTMLPPELVRVSERLWLLPTRTLPKLRLAGLGVTAPAVGEPPERVTLTVGAEPVFAMAKFPLTLPAVCGVKMTVKPWLWPAASVTGKLNPLTLKPAPVVVTCVTRRLDPPEFVRVAGWL